MKNYFKLVEFRKLQKMDTKIVSEEHNFLFKNNILANIPKKYWVFKWKQIHDDLLEKDDSNEEPLEVVDYYLRNLQEMKQEGHGLYIVGGYGTSKTTIATIILRLALKQEYSCFYMHASEIMDFVRASWKDDANRAYWKYITEEIEFLVIDDVARNFTMDDRERAAIDLLFVKRNINNLPIIMTANYNITDTATLFSDALASLLRENLSTVQLKGSDHRAKLSDRIKKRIQKGKNKT